MALIYQENIPLQAGDNLSFWYAVHNPIYLQFERKDFEVGAVADDGSGNAKVTLNTPDATKLALVEVGQSIYINAYDDPGTPIYKGVFTVIDTDNSTYITIDTPFTTNITNSDSFLNTFALIGYYVDVEINREDGTLLQLARFVPLFDGTMIIDIAGYVRRLAAIIDTHDYNPDTVIERDLHLSTAITVFYRERFNDEGSVPSYTQVPDTDQEIFWVNAAKQLGDLYGSNMAEYVPFPQSEGWNAKFLTLFTEPVFWMGYPFEIAVIISVEVINEYDSHFVLLIETHPTFSEVATSIDPDQPGVYRINISDDDVIFAGATAQYINVVIQSDGTPQDDQLTEVKKIWVKQCAQNSIYLKWINTLGGWSYWMFEFDQSKAIAVTEAKTFQQTIYDLATADSALQYLSKRAFPKMTIGADGVSAQNLTGLKGILYSPKVMWLTNPDTWNDLYEGGAKWQTVLVDPGSFTLENTRQGHANIEMTIEFVEINIQTQ